MLALGVGYLAYRTQSLVASIVFHALFNGVVCVGMVLSYAGPADGRDNFCGSPTIFGPCKSTRLQMQREFGQDELVQAHAFGFRFAGQGGVERLGHAHVELAAVLPPLRTYGRLGQALDQPVDLPAFFGLGERETVLALWGRTKRASYSSATSAHHECEFGASDGCDECARDSSHRRCMAAVRRFTPWGVLL